MPAKASTAGLIGISSRRIPSLWAQSALAQGVDEGRLLASGCFQCHGTNGLNGGFGTLAGVGKEDLLNKLNQDMRTKDARISNMNPHALGYTSYQLSLIANYFSRLPKP
jgi:sulfide dehydrogenase cytochrome subunit